MSQSLAHLNPTYDYLLTHFNFKLDILLTNLASNMIICLYTSI